jgi:hypothetical protein
MKRDAIASATKFSGPTSLRGSVRFCETAQAGLLRGVEQVSGFRESKLAVLSV